MAKGEERGRSGKTTASHSERFGTSYPSALLNNPFNANDEMYEEGNTSKTLDSPTKNTIDHCGLPLRKGNAYDKNWEGN